MNIRSAWMLMLSLAMLSSTACKEESSSGGGGDTDNGTDSASDSGADTETGWSTDIDTTHPADDVLPTDAYSAVPGGQDAADVPMFVSLGFDDNGYADGVNWILDFLREKKNADDSAARISFYMTTGYVYDDTDVNSMYAEPTTGDTDEIVASWKKAYEDGHEIGNHTQHHPMGFDKWAADFDPADVMTAEQWEAEMRAANEIISSATQGIGMDVSEIQGFRTPFLGYTDMTIEAAATVGFVYDCSIEEGWQDDQNGTNYAWPYDLKDGSPGDDYTYTWGNARDPIGSHPGLWEMSPQPLIAPPDYRAEEYGIAPGLRAKCKSLADYFETANGKVTGFDWNVWDEYQMSGDEALATLKYSLDLRLKGNRAPMMLGVHTDEYTEDNPDFMPPGSTVAERRKAIEDFLTYALSKGEVRVVPMKDILSWVKDNVTDTSNDTDSGTDTDTISGI
jgi:peptidoglycan/xylan/chitin deacetylase (PgdA/CDA1 family)